jgi:hypothetical protein
MYENFLSTTGQGRAPWTFLVELARGIQQMGKDGDVSPSARSNFLPTRLFA